MDDYCNKIKKPPKSPWLRCIGPRAVFTVDPHANLSKPPNMSPIIDNYNPRWKNRTSLLFLLALTFMLVVISANSVNAKSSKVTTSKAYENVKYNQSRIASFALTKGYRRKLYEKKETERPPFYTKITSNDAVAKPVISKNPIALQKPSKLFSTAPLMESATDKSFLSTSTSYYNNSAIKDSGPKIKLDPFFNILHTFQSLALGTSKEKKFSPSYQTIAQSIDENTKMSKANKSKKSKRKKKKKHKNAPQGHFEIQGPIPVPIPKSVITPSSEVGFTEDLEDTPTLHPLDVLNLPMSSSMKPVSLPHSRNEFESITKPSLGPFDMEISTNRMGLSHNAWDSSKRNKNSYNGTFKGSDERRFRSDFFENFHDSDVDLQADETRDIITRDSIGVPPTQHAFSVSSHLQFKQEEEELNANLGVRRPDTKSNFHSEFPEPTPIIRGKIKPESIDMVSKYPMSFSVAEEEDELAPALGVPPTRFKELNRKPHYPSNYNTFIFGNNYPSNEAGANFASASSIKGTEARVPFYKPPEASSDLQDQQSSADSKLSYIPSSNQKIGVGGFDLFYKQYKLLVWAIFFSVSALALLALVLYLYVNNPPTEVVTAKSISRSFESQLQNNPQILNILSNIGDYNHDLKKNSGSIWKRSRFKKKLE